MPGAQGDGMAHAISSLVQRRRSLATMQKKPQEPSMCKAREAMEWPTPFQALRNAADGRLLRFFLSAHVDAAVDRHGGAGHKAGQRR